MGVIGKSYNPVSSFIEDYAEVDFIVDEAAGQDDLEDEEVGHVPRRNRRVISRRAATPMNFQRCVKSSGSKKIRRYENTIQLAGDGPNSNDEEIEEVSILDFMPMRVSAFAQLLNTCNNLPFWNDFINCPDCNVHEEENKRRGQRLRSKNLKSRKTDISCSANQMDDLCSVKPDDDFCRVSGRFRTLLIQKRLSMGILADLEDKLISFFLEWPRNVYVSKLPSAYHRLLLHSLCQYLKLISRSCSIGGIRQTEVRNPQDSFWLPTMLLTKYLEDRYKL